MSKATSENESAKATADIEQQQFKEFLKQKDKTIIRAGQDGVVAYANDRWYDSSRQIREGATVYSLQKIFSLPDMTKMQVKVNIHESLIKKIKVGQKAEIRIESFPNIVFEGTVKSVSQLADSTRPWLTGGVKQYPTIVKLDDLKSQELKPGMTAEAKVLVGELDDVLVVPVQAVAEHKGEFFAFVEKTGQVKRQKVKIGENNETHVQILDGLAEGETGRPRRPAASRRRVQARRPESKAASQASKHATTDRSSPAHREPDRRARRPIEDLTMHRFYTTVLLAMRNLTLHKLRVLLTILGLIFGVGSVIAMLAIAEGASLEAQRQIAVARRDQCHHPQHQAAQTM